MITFSAYLQTWVENDHCKIGGDVRDWLYENVDYEDDDVFGHTFTFGGVELIERYVDGHGYVMFAAIEFDNEFVTGSECVSLIIGLFNGIQFMMENQDD